MPPKKLNWVARLAQSLHPPIPMTPKQGRSFEAAIRKIFNDEMEHEHGTNSSSSHTNLHIGAILNSPHFRGSNRRSVRPPSRKGPSQNTLSIAELQDGVAQPVQRFAREVAGGEATLHSATECLTACDYLRRHGVETNKQSSAQVVTNWLWSSGLEDSLEFIYDTKFVNALLPQLYREGKQARISNWHNRLFSPEFHSDMKDPAGSLGHLAGFLAYHVSTEKKFHGLDSALRLFNTIRETSVTNFRIGSADIDQVWENTHQKLLFTSGESLLAGLTATPLTPRPLEIKVDSYNNFRHHLGSWISQYKLEPMLALLDLSHPTSPSDLMALKVIHEWDRSMEDPSISRRRMQERVRLYVVAAEWYYVRDQQETAAEVMRRLDSLWPASADKPDSSSNLLTKLGWARTTPVFGQGTPSWVFEGSTG